MAILLVLKVFHIVFWSYFAFTNTIMAIMQT